MFFELNLNVKSWEGWRPSLAIVYSTLLATNDWSGNSFTIALRQK
jgi:hypothetical protein